MNKRALIIGAKRTIMSDLPDQEIAVSNDIQLIKNLLITNDWPENNIVTIHENNELNKSFVLSKLQEIAENTKPKDKIFLYYSGHGIERSFEQYTSQSLILYDSSLSDYDIRRVLRKADPGSVLIAVFDCCHSGTIIDFSPKINFPATIYMSACNDSEEAISYPAGSLFTSTICNLKLEEPQISYTELKKQLRNNIHEPQPFFTSYEVGEEYLKQNVAFH